MIKLALLSFSVGIFGLVHQYIETGVWFQFADIYHHEFIVAIFIWTGCLLIIGRYSR